MSASNFHESSDTNIRHFLKDIYQKSPRNVFSVYVTGGGSKALEWLFTVPGIYVKGFQCMYMYVYLNA
jgi:predicted metallopeptidase